MPPAPSTRSMKKRPSRTAPTDSGMGSSPTAPSPRAWLFSSLATTLPFLLQVRVDERGVLRREPAIVEQELVDDALERIAVQVQARSQKVLRARDGRGDEQRVRFHRGRNRIEKDRPGIGRCDDDRREHRVRPTDE